MIHIFLIGDSIRMGVRGEKGYGQIIEEKLCEKAVVYQPEENCRFTAYTLRYLHEWACGVPDREKIDYVFWNNGLWDTLILAGDGKAFTPLECYLDYIERIYRRIGLLFPNAEVVFINTTKVISELASADSTRSNAQIQEYNRAAEQLLSRYQVPCIDFYSISEDISMEKRADWVHYKTEGSEIFAEAVCAYLAKHCRERAFFSL